MNSDWNIFSWKRKSISQSPNYKNKLDLESVEKELLKKPPLVNIKKIQELSRRLESIALGERCFILQAGECAESFEGYSKNYMDGMISLIRDIGACISPKVLTIARLAGQFAKPRSTEIEIINGERYPIYRGDIINSMIDLAKRDHDPFLMLEAYEQSKVRLAHMRNDTEIYSSHEALLLNYESALSREEDGEFYDTSAHFLWIGERTRQLDGAHVEFLRNIKNPIGIKLSSQTSVSEVKQLCQILNPRGIPGKISFIVRMGKESIKRVYPLILDGLRDSKALFISDPMHGNTIKHKGIKTRYCKDIKNELESFFRIHAELGIPAHGVHLEVSSDDIMECAESEICVQNFRYTSKCDPRLNRAQSLEIANFIAKIA